MLFKIRTKTFVFGILVLLSGLFALYPVGGVLANSQHGPKVVASVKPVHGMVAAVLGKNPELIVSGNVSPHLYRLRPSDAKTLEAADIIFWIGPHFEGYLQRAIENLPKNARVISLMDAPGLALLPRREGALFEDSHAHHAEHEGHDTHEAHDGSDHADEHKDHEDHHDHESHSDHDMHEAHDNHNDHDAHVEDDLFEAAKIDPHVWLDPNNIDALVHYIATALGKIDPTNASVYAANADTYVRHIESVAKTIRERLAATQPKEILLSHDATQYFERYFGLAAIGAISLSPEIKPGLRRIRALQQHVRTSSRPICVFVEPGVNTGLPNLVAEAGGTSHIGVIDPEGIDLPAGADHGPQTLLQIARSFEACFRQ